MGGSAGASLVRTLARRLCVYGIVAALAVTALAQIEPWPLSSFRLFSLTRSGEEIRWELIRVDDGAETALDLASLGRGYRESAHYLPALAIGGVAARSAACSAWMSASHADEIRVYRSVYERRHPGDAAHLTVHKLRFRCTR